MGHHAGHRIGIATAVVVLGSVIALSGATSVASAATPPKTDVMFLFDTSGSMGGALQEAKEEVTQTMQQLASRLPETAFGVAQVEDYPGYEEGQNTNTKDEAELEADQEKPWRLDQAISGEQEKALSAIAGLATYGGGDEPEAYGRALWETDTNPNVGWRPGARHVIVLVADEVPHTTNVNEGIPEEFWAQNPFDTFQEQSGRWGIPGTVWAPGDDTEFPADLAQLADDGKPLAMVDYHDTGYDYIHYWEHWAASTGGAALEAEEGAHELAARLTSVITEAAAHELVGCPSGYFRAGEEPCQPLHATSTALSCAVKLSAATDTCTAQVTDASAAGATVPGGTVTFSATGGTFPSGATCTLAAVSAASSSCSVAFVPPAAAYRTVTEIKRIPPVLERLAEELEKQIALMRAASPESLANAASGGQLNVTIEDLKELVQMFRQGASSIEALAEQAKQIAGNSSPAAQQQLSALASRLAELLQRLISQTVAVSWDGAAATTFRNEVTNLQSTFASTENALQAAAQERVLATYSGDGSHATSNSENSFPPASAFASAAALSSSGSFTPSSVSIPVSCQFACVISGELESLGASASASSLQATAAKKHRRKHAAPTVLGSGHLKLGKAGKATLVLKMSRKGRALLARAHGHSIRLRLLITIATPFGTLVREETRTVTLHPARKHGHRRH